MDASHSNFAKPPYWLVVLTVSAALLLIYLDHKQDGQVENPQPQVTQPRPERFQLPSRLPVGQPIVVPLAP